MAKIMKLRGGKRPGAGRPKGVATKPIRVPAEIADEMYELARSGALSIPLYSSRVAAGVPAAAEDHIEDRINIFEYLVDNPPATFFVRADGDSMMDVGITPNTILSVDKSREAKHGHIVIAAVDGMLTVKRLHKKSDGTMLLSENEKKNYPPIVLGPEMNVTIWGVVRGTVNLFAV